MPRGFNSFATRTIRTLVGAFRSTRRMDQGPGAPRLPSSAASKAVIIVCAHPDDEVIGAGILMTQLPGAKLVQVTDGAPRDGKIAKALGLSGWEEYAQVRRRETEHALAISPSNVGSIDNMAIADQEAIYNVELLTQKLMDILPGHEAVITHAYEGGHPDHDATALAVHAACRLLEKSGRPAPLIIEMIGYHFLDGREVFDSFLVHSGAGREEKLVLSPAQKNLKQRMFNCYRTQSYVLKDFPIGVESFRQAPCYDFSRPPHPGVLFYERSGAMMTASDWRDQAGRALRSLDLANPL